MSEPCVRCLFLITTLRIISDNAQNFFRVRLSLGRVLGVAGIGIRHHHEGGKAFRIASEYLFAVGDEPLRLTQLAQAVKGKL